jgi:hypothetical protein
VSHVLIDEEDLVVARGDDERVLELPNHRTEIRGGEAGRGLAEQ